MVALENRRASSLAAQQKRQLAPLETATSTPKNRVWGFESSPSGRPNTEQQLSWETAAGSVQYTYQIASGRAEWLSRDPIGEIGGSNLYAYVNNNVLNYIDPMGLYSQQLPPNWQNLPCSDLADLAQQMADQLQDKWNDMNSDPSDLYNSQPTGPNSWAGHQNQYKGAQNQLQKVIDQMNKNGCGSKVPSDANYWAQEPAPSAPAPKPSSNPSVPAPSPTLLQDLALGALAAAAAAAGGLLSPAAP